MVALNCSVQLVHNSSGHFLLLDLYVFNFWLFELRPWWIAMSTLLNIFQTWGHWRKAHGSLEDSRWVAKLSLRKVHFETQPVVARLATLARWEMTWSHSSGRVSLLWAVRPRASVCPLGGLVHPQLAVETVAFSVYLAEIITAFTWGKAIPLHYIHRWTRDMFSLPIYLVGVCLFSGQNTDFPKLEEMVSRSVLRLEWQWHVMPQSN